MKKILKFILGILPSKLSIQLRYYYNFHRFIDFHNPKTFNEKLQWLKLYNRKPIYTTMVDKYSVKQYVAEIIGEEYIIPTLGVWENPDYIDWNILPERFVLKTTHAGGSEGVVICKDFSEFDKKSAIEKLNKSYKTDSSFISKEWPYRNVQRRIIAEQYMEDESGELRDYKFFCFDGEVKAMFIATDRQKEGEEVKFDFYDMQFKHLPFTQGHPNSTKELQCPQSFEKMKELACALSKDIPQVRVDFYEVNGQVYFGELTFFHFSGMVPFCPQEWDVKFGEWIKLPQKNCNKLPE